MTQITKKNTGRRIKKFTSVLLALCLIFSMIPAVPAYGTPVSVTGTMEIGGETGIDLSANSGDPDTKGWVWGADTATLTLHSNYGGEAIHFNTPTTAAVHLTLAGDVTVSTAGIAYGIKSEGSLTIDTASHTLNVIENHNNYGASAIESGNTLTVKGSGTLKATHASDSNGKAIYAAQDISISDSVKVTAEAVTYGSGIWSNSGSVEISGNSKVEAFAKGLADIGIYAQGQSGTITISDNAEVTGINEDNVAMGSRDNFTISGNAQVNPAGLLNSDIASLNKDIIINTTGKVQALKPSLASVGVISTNSGKIILQNGTVSVTNTANTGSAINAKGGMEITGGTLITNATGSAVGHVRGDLTVNGAAAEVTINGNILAHLPGAPGNLTISAGAVTLSGTVAGSTSVTGGTLCKLISTEAQLKAIDTDDTTRSINYRLTEDIALTSPWTPIWDFNGELDGNGHKITGLHVAPSGSQAGGLFNNINAGGKVKNLNLVIAPGGINGYVYAGGVAGGNSGTIEKVSVSGGPVQTTALDGCAGGIAGLNSGTIEFCYNASNVTATGNASRVGGIAGESNDNSEISESANTGNVTASGSSSNVNYAGGLAGELSGKIINSYNWGTVSATGNDSRIGGLAGKTAPPEGKIESSYSAGTVSASHNTTYMGGLLGDPTNLDISYSFFDKTLAPEVTFMGGNSPGNFEKTTEQMKSGTPLPGWDFNTIWTFAAGAYPALKHVAEPPLPAPNPVPPVSKPSGGSVQPAAPPVTVTGTTATTTIVPTVSSGTAAASVTAAQMSETIGKAQEAAKAGSHKPQVEIRVESTAEVSSVATTIPQSSVLALQAASIEALTISGGLATLRFDASSIQSLSAAGATGNMTFSIAKADTSALSQGAKALIGNRPVYEFSVTGAGKAITQFGGNVTVSLPYTLGAGEDPNAIIISFINEDSNLEIVTNGRYDEKTKAVIFITDHFSQYAIGYNKINFSDVKASGWYADAVSFLAAREITGGTTETTFSPNSTLTRGQFITLLLRAYGIEPQVSGSNAGQSNTVTENFSDAGDAYYTGYLAAAKALGITKGVGDNKFAPEKAITRQEMFTLLYNALTVMESLPKDASGKTLSDFIDSSRISSYARDAMAYLVENGVTSGSNGLLTPADTTTRGQMAQVFYNLLNK